MIKKISIVLSILVLSAFGFLFYLMNKPHKDISNEATSKITAMELFDDFNTNEAAANEKYLNKALQVTGIVDLIEKNQDNKNYIVLLTNDELYGVMCTMKSKEANVNIGEKVNIKGYCSGFAGDVKLTDCIITKK